MTNRITIAELRNLPAERGGASGVRAVLEAAVADGRVRVKGEVPTQPAACNAQETASGAKTAKRDLISKRSARRKVEANIGEAEVLAAVRKILAVNDLLAALTEITEQAENYCRSTGHKDKGAAMFGACDAICRAIPDARAAIEKARGAAD